MNRNDAVNELLQVFLSEGFDVHGAMELEGYDQPPPVTNDGFGDLRARCPDVVGFDPEKRRVVFGIVRLDRISLDCEDSLTDYNVFLNHNSDKGTQASVVFILLPGSLLNEFTAIVTHYIHREYWHRIIPVVSRGDVSPGGNTDCLTV